MLPSFSEIARISKCTMVYFLISKSRQSELSGTFFVATIFRKILTFLNRPVPFVKMGGKNVQQYQSYNYLSLKWGDSDTFWQKPYSTCVWCCHRSKRSWCFGTRRFSQGFIHIIFWKKNDELPFREVCVTAEVILHLVYLIRMKVTWKKI